MHSSFQSHSISNFFFTRIFIESIDDFKVHFWWSIDFFGHNNRRVCSKSSCFIFIMKKRAQIWLSPWLKKKLLSWSEFKYYFQFDQIWQNIILKFIYFLISLYKKFIYKRVSIFVLNQFLRVSRKFENIVTFVKVWVWSLSWDFFPHTFFIHFIKFSSAVEMSSSIQNFSPIKIFLKELFNIFGFWKSFENFFSQVLPIWNVEILS